MASDINPTIEKARQKAKEFRQREKDILRQAQDLFVQHGEDKVTVELIAESAGIGKGTIYKHFQTKYEIYMRLMIEYEEELADLFASISLEDDQDRLIRAYYDFRMSDPDRYALFARLESKCASEPSVRELMAQLHRTRVANLDKLQSLVNARIKEGVLIDCPAYFHICAAWAMVHGAVALYESDFFKQLIEDKQAFFDFLLEVSVRLGVKRTR
jgi:hypothetical protein